MKEKMQIVISIVLALALMAAAYFLIIYEPTQELIEIDDNSHLSSDIASTDPQVTASRFLQAVGNMGDVENDITQESMETSQAILENGARRLRALNYSKTAIIPGSPLISDNESNNIETFTRGLDAPYIYRVENVKISEPSKPESLTVYTANGTEIYNAIKLLASFDSVRIHYTAPKDTSYDGTHTQISNTEAYNDVEIILVQIGELWFVYDVVDSEYVMNERFATWSGVGTPLIDYSKDLETGTFRVEGVESYVEDDDNEN